MLNLRTEEIAVIVFLTLIHFSFYHYFTQPVAVEKSKPLPILIELISPKPKPIPIPAPKIVPLKVVEPPNPKKALPLKSPKAVKKLPKPAVEKPKLQQKSVVKIQAEEIIEKELVEHPQQLSEPEVKKTDTESAEKAVKAVEKVEEAAPAHEPVMTKAEYGGSCRSALNRYPAEAREQGVEGTVKIKVQVLADGGIGNADIVKSSGSDILDNSVLEHVRDCDFEPAQKDGVPVTTSVIIPVRFKLDN